MSRVAKAPIVVPKGVTVEISGQDVTVKGSKGTLAWSVHPAVTVSQVDGEPGSLRLKGMRTPGPWRGRHALC